MPTYNTTLTPTTNRTPLSKSKNTDGTSDSQSDDGNGAMSDFGDVIDTLTFEQVRNDRRRLPLVRTTY
jgi:hypothetical protein